MRKYLLFAGHNFYPKGGFDDFRTDFDSEEAAENWFNLFPDRISDLYIDHWGQIVDRDTFKIVKRLAHSVL